MRMPLGLSRLALSAAFCAVAVLAGSPVPAESLAEVAAKNKDKDKKGKVYTEADLRGRPGAGSVSQPASDAAVAVPVTADAAKKPEGAATGPEAEKPKTDEELKAEAQKAWQEKKAKAEADVTRLNNDIAKLQTALGDLTGPLYGGSRTGLLNRMDESKKQLAAAQQSVADLTDEGRRAGYR
jgi:hypothetical protein